MQSLHREQEPTIFLLPFDVAAGCIKVALIKHNSGTDDHDLGQEEPEKADMLHESWIGMGSDQRLQLLRMVTKSAADNESVNKLILASSHLISFLSTDTSPLQLPFITGQQGY